MKIALLHYPDLAREDTVTLPPTYVGEHGVRFPSRESCGDGARIVGTGVGSQVRTMAPPHCRARSRTVARSRSIDPSPGCEAARFPKPTKEFTHEFRRPKEVCCSEDLGALW